jgi:hypothetical protein
MTADMTEILKHINSETALMVKEDPKEQRSLKVVRGIHGAVNYFKKKANPQSSKLRMHLLRNLLGQNTSS